MSSDWTKDYDSLTLKISVPVNSCAKVSVPKRGWQQVCIKEGDASIWKNGTAVQGVEGISRGEETEEYVTFDVGSGVYCFEVREG